MQRRIAIILMSTSLLLGFALWCVGREVKAKARLAPPVMRMPTLAATGTHSALRSSAVPDARDAEATARDVSGTTVASHRTGLTPELRKAVEKSRYRIRPSQRVADAGAYQASNPAQELSASFSGAGLGLRPHTASAGTWHWSMQLQGFGYGERMQRVAPAELVVTDNRIEYRRGTLTEWYVNEAGGLEQGFTLAEPPVGREAGAPLVLQLRVSGDLLAEASADRRNVRFTRDGGEPALGYSHLAAFDAEGKQLAARMRVVPGSVRLEVDDRDAAYPVLIDPLIFTETHLFAGDAAPADFFGHSVAISGDTMVVGAPFDNTAAGDETGSAYVYVRSGTIWSEQAHLFAGDAAPADLFGHSVAISGDTIVVGALLDDTVAGANAGSAHVYVRSGTTWSEQAHLFASDAAPSDRFGESVAISGDTVVVGAPEDFAGAAGSAYVYVRSGTTWTEQAHLSAGDAASGDLFGFSVAISGDTIVVGAPLDDTAARNDPGSAYVYVRSGTTWSEQAHLFASDPDPDPSEAFGASVAISGQTVVVGVPNDIEGGDLIGSAYVYVRSGTTWSEQAHLFASDGAHLDLFGWSVAISGETIVVGAPRDDTAAGENAGSVYVYVRSGMIWSAQAHLFAGDAAAGDRFGESVAISGETIIAGSPNDDTIAGQDAGSAYVYTPSTDADVEVRLQDSPDPVTTGQTLTYTLSVTNHGPGPATVVTVNGFLPAETTFVNCLADQGGRCVATRNTVTASLPSLAPNAMATITITTTVNCNVSVGQTITSTTTVDSSTFDPNPRNNTVTATTTVLNPPPVVTSSVATSSLWPPNSDLVNVGLTASATDNCSGVIPFQVQVFGDENDETPTSPQTVHSPDARDVDLGTLRLRSERVEGGDGRVYLIVVKATDSGGRVGFRVHTVVVPVSQSPEDINAVNSQAAAARSYALQNGGSPPPGYYVIGDGTVIGPKQ